MTINRIKNHAIASVELFGECEMIVKMDLKHLMEVEIFLKGMQSTGYFTGKMEIDGKLTEVVQFSFGHVKYILAYSEKLDSPENKL
jgi:hypothetical protein